MSAALPQVPGLYFDAAPRPAAPSPLRSDVAGFIGRTRRGTPGCLCRVEGWRAYAREFGGLDADAFTSYAVRGYFENGGQVAYVVRLCGRNVQTASALWEAAKLDGGQLTKDSPTALRRTKYRIEASSPGRWARDVRVHLRYRRAGASGTPELDIVVRVPGVQVPPEPVEYLLGLDPAGEGEDALEAQVARRSQFIRLVPDGEPLTPPAAPAGPLQASWEMTLELAASADKGEAPTKFDYLDAIEPQGARPCPEEKIASGLAREWPMGDEREVAIVALPDLHTDIADEEDRFEVLSILINQAEESRDRLLLIDLPHEAAGGGSMKDADKAAAWVESLRALHPDERVLRAAAVYHPRLRVTDPLGGILNPLRSVPPSGHVAGVISRLDRERGAHHTPANAAVYEAIDISASFDEPSQGALNACGINLLRCAPGRGIQVWGGRTLRRDEAGRFVAHRRLIHRLVRAIRRVAEPLVFHTNGPELWLTFVRSMTTVLLEAYRAGGLKGARPEEAFRVRCDEKTNPPEEVERGRLLCEIEVAPAVPMEFITLRIAMSADATLEVIEA